MALTQTLAKCSNIKTIVCYTGSHAIIINTATVAALLGPSGLKGRHGISDITHALTSILDKRSGAVVHTVTNTSSSVKPTTM